MLSEKQIFSLLLENKQQAILDKKHFDDAAIINFNGINMAISTDFIRGTGFNIYESGYLTLGDLAHYLVAANASDIAAMGIIPSGFLDIFRYPLDTDEATQRSFFTGLKEASKHYNVKIVGGDSGSYDNFVLGGTCFGFSTKNSFLYRNKAKAGDLIYVSGQTGRCRAAQIALLELGEKHFTKEEIKYLVDAWKRPNPPLELGPFLAENKISVCGQDTSDGLGDTVKNICKDSNLGATIYQDKLPQSEIIQKVASLSHRDVSEIILSTSPDFQLLFTINPLKQKLLEESNFLNNLHCIGEITDSHEVILQKGNKAGTIKSDSWNQSNSFII